MNGVQGVLEAAESKTEDSRQNAQESQKATPILVLFALLGGYSVNVNPPDQFGFKLSQTDAAGQAGDKIYVNTLT